MPSCVIRYCTNYSSKTSKAQCITYHSFPSDELRRIEWTEAVRKQRKEEYWQPNQSSKICSIHFKDEDKYTSGKGLMRLKKSAFPILEAPPEIIIPDSPNSLAGDEDTSDLESIFESAREAALKKCLRMVNFQKQKLIMKNKNLKKQNKRLKNRVSNIKNILKHLKKKYNIPKELLAELNVNVDKVASKTISAPIGNII